MRLAFVSPLPPLATGVADYAADLLPTLSRGHEIDVFHAQDDVETSRLPAGTPVRPASELVERHRLRPYDLALYQMGNGRPHDFVYDLLSRLPGLLVLHDLVLHHARAAQFLESEPVRAWGRDPSSRAAREAARGPLDAWRAELEYSYPGRGERLSAVHLGTVGDLLPYAYPLFRIPVEASRAVAVHNAFMAEAIHAEVPAAHVMQVPMPAAAAPSDPRATRALRARLGFGADDVVVGSFGLLTAEKRVETVARAVGRAAARDRRIRLLLAGPVADPARLDAALDRLGVRGLTVATGRVPLADLPAHVDAADVVAHLRYPTARETSAALLRVLAQGRATIVSDLAHQADLPEDAVVRVDATDEEGGLVRAILRLAADPAARSRLGRAAADHVRRAHAPTRVRAAWEDALERARGLPAPRPGGWPAHWPRP
ncbi:MAG TPA: glycosyltransferase [Vicinamibacteria bacterium]|nr:glycosyltransferase [Vicinamibacteria bacterium]